MTPYANGCQQKGCRLALQSAVLAYQQAEKSLSGVTDAERLESVLKAAAQAKTVEEFQASLSNLLAENIGTNKNVVKL